MVQLLIKGTECTSCKNVDAPLCHALERETTKASKRYVEQPRRLVTLPLMQCAANAKSSTGMRVRLAETHEGVVNGWSHQTHASTTRMRRSAMRMRSINCFEAIHRETASPRDAPRIPVFRGCFAAGLPMCVQELSSEQPRR